MEKDNGQEAKIPDLWTMAALLRICPGDVKEQMQMRLDEIGEKYDILKEKILGWTANRVETEGDDGGARPMDIGKVEEKESEDDWWTNAVESESLCHNCGGLGHYARNCPKGGGKGGGKSKGYQKGKGDFAKGGYGKGFGGGGKGFGGKGYGGGGKGFGGGGKGFGYQGLCFNCGKIGHKAAECRGGKGGGKSWWANGVDEQEEEEGEEADCGGVFMIGCVDCDSSKGRNYWKSMEPNKTPVRETEEFWECIEYDDEFHECIQKTPEEAMVVYLLKERKEEVRNKAAEEEIELVQAAEEMVEGIVLTGGKREVVQRMVDLVSAEKWKTKKSKTRNQRKIFLGRCNNRNRRAAEISGRLEPRESNQGGNHWAEGLMF